MTDRPGFTSLLVGKNIDTSATYDMTKGAFKVSIKLRKSKSLSISLPPSTSPHSAHKGSIESPLTPDTIHYFQAWNTHRSTPRGQNERMAYLYKYAVLLRHVTCTCTLRYAPGILQSPRGSHCTCEESGTCFHPTPLPLPHLTSQPQPASFGPVKVVQVTHQCESFGSKLRNTYWTQP